MDAANGQDNAPPPKSQRTPGCPLSPPAPRTRRVSSSWPACLCTGWQLHRKEGGLPLAPAVVSIQRRQGDSDHPPKPLAGGHGLLPEGQGQTMMASDTNTVSKFGPEQSAVEGISGTQTSLPQMKNHKGAWLCPELLMEENHFS